MVSNDELQRNLWMLYSQPPRPRISPETTALLCIDLQYFDAAPQYGVGAKAHELDIADFLEGYFERVTRVVLPHVKQLQESARSKGVEVIHVRVASRTRDGRDSTLRYKRMGLRTPAQTKEAEILPEVAPIDDELVIDKITSSPFNSTNIDRVLRNLGLQNLILTGVVTNGCVESTARSAAELDYGVIVVEDAVAAIGDQLHEHSILSMSYKDASIMSTAEVLSGLDALPLVQRDTTTTRR